MKKTAVKATKPEPLSKDEIEQIVRSIREMGELGKRLQNSGLSRRAVLVLLNDVTGLPLSTVKKVLDGLVVLPSTYLVRQ